MISVILITEVLTIFENENLINNPNMKNLIRLLSLFTITGFILTSCEGPMGPAGKDGLAGLDGKDGKDANETCKECHNSTVVEKVAAEFEFSKHFTGLAAEDETGNAGCAPCHESEGFKYVINCYIFFLQDYQNHPD